MHFRLNTDPDPAPIRIQGFYGFKWVIFAPLDPDPHPKPEPLSSLYGNKVYR
jgi:hypothetical protein